MGYFPVRYDSRVVIYDRRGFIRLATAMQEDRKFTISCNATVHCKFIVTSLNNPIHSDEHIVFRKMEKMKRASYNTFYPI